MMAGVRQRPQFSAEKYVLSRVVRGSSCMWNEYVRTNDCLQTQGEDERRFFTRVSEQCSASVTLPDRRRIRGETVDVSRAGVCLTLPQALELGHEYHFHIDREVNDKKQRLDVVGRVCFCISRGDQFRIGLHCPDIQLSAQF